MELAENCIEIRPNYMRMAYDCLHADCTTWYTQEAEIAFARYLAETNKYQATSDDLLKWKQLLKI